MPLQTDKLVRQTRPVLLLANKNNSLRNCRSSFGPSLRYLKKGNYRSPPERVLQKPLKRREPRRTRRALRRAFLFLSGLSVLRGSRLLSFLPRPPERVSQKPLKRREPQRHGDTKFFPGLPRLRPADKKGFLCALVSLWFTAFMPFATLSRVASWR